MPKKIIRKIIAGLRRVKASIKRDKKDGEKETSRVHYYAMDPKSGKLMRKTVTRRRKPGRKRR